jgi:deazaflavin-dependent oxidoreductase (nitroreductase family)
MAYKDLVNRFSTTRVGSWIARQLAARIDPWIYRQTRGRLTSTGPPTIPQLILTTRGQRSGRPRAVQLGYLRDDRSFVVVASNFGRQHNPAWSYNLLAAPEATVYVDGRETPVRAEQVTEGEKENLWPRLDAVVPQFKTYRRRTDRNIRVFRLRSVDETTEA